MGGSSPRRGLLLEVPQAECVTDERVPEAVRPYYEDAIRVLEAVGAHASRVDEKTARLALQFTTPILRNLFQIPTEPPALAESEDEPE